MDRTALVSLGNQVVVIGLDGKLRVLTEGQQPLPGEVVVTSTDVGPLDLNVQLTQEQGSKDVTDDVLQIISAIEQGQDPSAVDEEFAPAAGENGGSSLQTSATIVRDGTELLASTSFETIGIESLGLSQTEVLALNDLFRSNLQTSADSTDKLLATTPVTLDAIEEDGGSIIITTEELLSNVDDEDKDTLSVENLIIDKGNGTLVDNGDGTWTFTPQIDDDTEVSFTFDIIDDEDLVVSGSANLDILPINDAPNAENDVITTGEDTAVTIDVLVNDSDVEGDVLSIQSASVPSEQGSVDIVDGKLVFTPAENFNGEATITYIVTDGDLTDEAKVTVTVTPVNDSPVAVDDTTSIQEDTAVTIDVLTNDTDVDGDKLSIESASVPKEQGTVEVVDGKLVFTPAENFNGDAEITYTVTDGELTDEAKVTVTVNPVNDAPTIKVDAVESITEDAVNTDTVVAALTVRDTDTPEDQLAVSLENNSNGYFVLVGNEVKLTQAGVDAVNNDELNLKDLTISASVSDGVNPTASDSDSLVVNRVNDAPTVENAIADQVLSEDFDAYTIDLNEVFKDSDSALNFSVSGNNSIQISIVNGVATITPTADWNGKETITFTATDPSGESISQTVNFTVAPVADIVADKATVVEDTPTIIKVLGNDTFEDDGKVVSLDTNNGPANGTVSVNPDGSVTYTPNDNYHGIDSFTYIVTSGGVSESTTVNVDVTPENDAPVAKDDTAITDEDTPVTIDVLPNDTDVDGDKLSIESASVPKEQGTVEVVNGKLVFTPTENFNGHAEITYTVTDGQLTDEAKVTVTVNPVNDAPTIKVDAVESITEDAVNTDTVVATLTVRDTDTSEDQLTVSLENNSNGYFVLVGNEVKLTQAGVDAVNNDELNLKDLTISASVSDGVNPTANDSDSLIVNRVNDAPTVENAIADQELSEDFATYTIDLNDAFKDSDSALNFSVSGNSNVLVSIENGIATISPTADWNGSETLTFTATDPSGESISQTVNFTVAPVADIVADKATVVEDTSTIIKVLGNDTFEGDGKVVSLDTNNGPANGTVSVNPDGSVTYTPNDNYHGTDSFTYIVTSGGVSESTTVSVDVTPENDAPVAKDDTAITDEDTPVTIDVLPNDTDVDGDKLSVESASVPKEQGTVEVVNGKLVFTPAENFNGDAEITYTVTDGELTDEAKVAVTVNPVNDAPTIKVDAVESITEDAVNTDTVVASLTVRDTDTPEDQLTVSLENNSNGYFVLVGNEVKLTQAGVDAVNNDELNLKDLTISASVSDGVNPTANDSDSLVVNRVNDAPTVENAIADQVLSEDFDAYTIDLNEVFKDSDSSLEFSVSGNNSIQISIVNGVATINPTADWNGKETITFTAKDPSGESVSQTVDFTVAPVVDIKADSTNVVEDTPTIINVLGNDTFDGDDKVVSLDTNNGPANGTVSVNPDGSVTYTPNDNYHGADSFTYIVTSGGVSESTTVNVDVTPVNDAPVATNDTVITDEDTPVTIDVLPNDTDADGDKLSIESASVPKEQGTVEVVNGKLVFTPAENFNGDAEITYTVTDGQLTDEAKVTVTVNPVNDAPTIKVDAVESITEDAVNTDTVVAALTVRDTDTPEDQLAVSLENNSNGYFVLVGNEVKLTQAGVDAVNNDELNLKDLTISASVSDGVNPTASDSDSLIVNRVNDAPTVENAIADQVLSEDFDAYTIDLNEVFKDSDSSLEFSVSGNNSIQISIVSGVATITPTADWNGKETITFSAKDPSGESVSQTVNFTVTPVADIEADKTTVVEDTPTIIKVLGNDTFEGKDKVVSLDAENGPKNGTVIVNNDGTVTYTPNDNYVGKDTFTYIVTSGGVSESTTVEVNVTPVNDAPVAKDDIATTLEDTAVTIDVLPNDTDVDGDKLSIQSASVPEAQGKVEIVDGKLVFTPAENFNGHAEIIYTVTDGQLTDEAKVTVTVNPVNDAPTIKVDAVESITEDAVNTDTVVATLTVRDTDTSEDQLTVSLENNSNGYFVLVGDEVKLTQAGVDAVNNDELNLKDLTISASVSDGVNPTANDSDSLIVNRVNDAPTVENAIADQELSEDFATYTIDLNDAFKDSDSALNFSVSGNSNVLVSIENGIATISPTADWNGSETLTFTATDSSGESISQTVNFTVAPVADIVADKATVVEDTPTIIKVLGNDTFEGDDQEVSLDTNNGPANGTVSVNPDGSVTYTPNDNYHGTDSFTYIVTSGGVSESTTVSVDVTPVNDAPVAKDDIATTQEDTVVTIDVLPNDTDVDGDKLSVESASVPKEQGTVEVVNGKLVFTPAENFNGDAEITYTVTDGQLTDEAKVTVTVNPVNDAPTIKVDAVESITEDAVSTDTVVATLTVRDTDTPEDQLTVSLENNSNGYFVLVGDEVKLTQAGVDAVNNDELNLKDLTISASVSDGVNPTANDSDSLIVNRVNDAPTIKVDAVESITEDAVSTDTVVATLTVRDTDTPEDQLTVSLENNSNGYFVLVGDEVKLTQAGVDAVNNDELNLKDLTISASVSDGVNPTANDSDSLVVNRVNDAPTVENAIADQVLSEDFDAYTIDLNEVFKDSDSSLEFSVSGNNSIQISIVNGVATITPTADWNGKETITFTATDPSGESISQRVDFTVAPVADIVADKATVVEDTPTIIKVLGNDTFEGDGKVVSLDTNNGPANGSVSVNPDGSVTYTPNDNYHGIDSFTYIVTSGGVSESTTVYVDVTPENDAPVAKDDTAITDEDTPVTIDVLPNDTDVDGDKLSIESASVPKEQGTVEVVNGKLVFTPAENFNGDAEITYTVTDGALTDQATVKVTVNAVNDTPVVESNIADQTSAEDFTPYTIDLNTAFSDVDNVDGELTFSVSGNSNIQVAIVNGIATITPTADWNGSETLTFTATDPSGESVSQTVDFTVAPVVDIKADSTNVVEDTPTIINVLGNDTFEGKDKVVSLDAENGPKNGTVIVNNDGTVTYTPDDNYVGKDTFTYVVTSGGVSESTTVTVNVTPVNDKPESEDFTHVADDQLTQVVFDTDTKPLGSGDSKDHIADVEDDLKGNDLHVRITELPTSGTLFFKDSDGELHEIKEVSDTLYDKDSLYYEADNVGFLLGIKDRPNTPNGSESTSDFNNWGLSEDGGPSHSRTEHLANGASITISSDSGELAQYNRQVSHIGNGIADNDGQGIEKGETITIDLSNNPVGSVNLGLDGLGGLFDYGDDNAALITVTYLDSNNAQQTQTFEFLKPEGNFMLFQETSVGYGKELALPEGSVITQLDFSTKNEGNWELRYVEGVPAEDSFGYVAVDSESGVSDPSTVNIVNEMLDGNVTENGPAVQSITGVTVVEGDNVTFSVSLNNATDQTVKYQVDFSAEGSSTSSQDIDLSNATFTNGVKYLGGYLIVPAGVNGFEITIPSIDDQLVESTESLVIKVGDVSGVGYIDDNDVPPTVQSNEISGLEDEAIVITLEHLGVVDSGVSVEFDTSALNGSLQVKGSDGWEAVSGSVLASDIENGLVRYVPAEHESGANVFDKDGVGNGLDTYEQIHFTVSDGNSSASGTLSIDIEPVADPIKIDLTFGPVTSVPVTLGGSWSTDEELKELLEASNLPGLDFEHVVTQAFNNGHAGNDLMLSGDTESPLSFVGDQQAGANVDAQGSDIFVTGGGNDSIYGGIGSLDDQAETDTVVYSGKLSDYDFSYYPASDHSEVPYWIVEDSRFIDTKDVVSSTHKESGDHLYEIEQLIFQDAIIKLDNNTGEYVVLTEQQVSFELNLDLIDVDGSESFINDSVTLTGIPSGLTLEVNGKTVTENSDGSYTVDLSSEPNQTSHQLSGTITVPADYNGSLDFDVTATAGSVEVNNNTQMGADTASVSVRDYEFVSGTHGDNNIVGSDDNDVIVGDVQGLQIVEGQDYNIAFMLDTSGSMGYDVGRAVTELKTVLNTLIESASGPHSGKVNVLLTTFSTESKQVLELDLSSDNAKSQVESILDAIVKLGDGNTNYEAGFQSALNWFENADSGATNLSYFISDGRPNQATDNNVNWYSSKESVVLGVSEQQLVTLADVLPSDYRFGDTVTYNNKTVIDFRGTVYSLSTGEEMGRMLNSYEYDDFGNNVLEQANNAYSALAEFSEVRSIGIGGHLNEDSLKHFDSDGVVRTNIDVNQLAEVILGKEVSLMQGKDEISSLDGNDIIFGDAIRFNINGEQGVSALQNYVASQLGKDVALVTKEEVHHYITENQAEFEQSRYYDQADTIYGGAGNDILFGQGGNDKLFGGADNDILIGGLGSDILTGGDGEDIFKWIDVANERDTVTDFSSSEDSLDFSDLFDDLSKDEVGDLLSDLQSGSHTGDAGGYHVEVSQDGSADTNLSITKGSSTLDIHFNSASVDDITQHLIASLDSQYKDM
ncbi:tandem-95 repeat protein [Vibrio parahaemolyticus]|uniref:tandem-95 repeat protein n=1 Tax=Vibrio parahaemolyticus TaxID=670 RepID=UPI0027E55A9F|nr:tandem-95 repeat protein [Vibrio parahaemolyticus]WMN84273.1 tandem-95 repeat protein [Vibrio parahaemolyticus]